MFKSLVAAAVVGSTGLFASVPAMAASDEVTQWVEQVNRKIDMHLHRASDDTPGSGTVTFRRGADGRPVDVAVRSGNRMVALVGARAIRSMRNLPALPAGLPANQRITFHFLIGDPSHADQYWQQRGAMYASDRTTNSQLAARLDTTQVAALERR